MFLIHINHLVALLAQYGVKIKLFADHGRRNRGSRVSGCSPNFWGAGAVLPRKFGDVTD